MRAGHPSRTPIGVDIGVRTIKAAQLTRGGGRDRAFALALLPRPSAEKEIGADDALALRKVLKRQGFSGRKIVITAPEKALLRATLELPSKVSGAPIGQIVRMELSRLHNVALDSFEMAHWELAAPDGSKPMVRALTVGCPHDAADAILDVFDGSGFDVVAMDVRSAAAARACAPLVLPAPAITSIVDLGWHSTTVLFVCGRALIYERSLGGSGVVGLVEKLMETFSIPLEAAQQIMNTIGLRTDEPEGQFERETLDAIHKLCKSHLDKLLEELRIPLAYVSRQFPGDGVKRLLLIGGGGAVAQVPSYLGQRLGLEVMAAAPGNLVESPPELLGKAANPVMTVAVGLAQFKET